jgi:hypothetical protein
VSSVTLMENALMSGIVSNTFVTVDGEEHRLYRNAIGPAFLETLGVELLAGRVPGRQDNEEAPLVGAVNKAAVRELFGGESPVGQILHLGGRDVQIVGVVGDTPYQNRRDPVPPTLFESALQRRGYGGHHIVMRTDLPAAQLEPAVREAVFQVDADLPVPELQTQTGIMAEASARERVFTNLLTLFGAFALLLASIGLYGVTSQSVARRTSEIGVRVAVGARGSQILWMILRQVAFLAGGGDPGGGSGFRGPGAPGRQSSLRGRSWGSPDGCRGRSDYGRRGIRGRAPPCTSSLQGGSPTGAADGIDRSGLSGVLPVGKDPGRRPQEPPNWIMVMAGKGRWCMARSLKRIPPFPLRKSPRTVAVGHPETGHRVQDLAGEADLDPLAHE